MYREMLIMGIIYVICLCMLTLVFIYKKVNKMPLDSDDSWALLLLAVFTLIFAVYIVLSFGG